MAFSGVFNTEVVDNDPKNNWAPFVVLESGSCDIFKVTGFVKADAEKIICQFCSLWKDMESSDNFEIDSSIAGVFGDVVSINELLRGI